VQVLDIFFLPDISSRGADVKNAKDKTISSLENSSLILQTLKIFNKNCVHQFVADVGVIPYFKIKISTTLHV
jgi:hypothetical protein